MKSTPRNIILDLLPVYIAGEASEESRDLVEEFAREDPEIARLIGAGKLEPAEISAKMAKKRISRELLAIVSNQANWLR